LMRYKTMTRHLVRSMLVLALVFGFVTMLSKPSSADPIIFSVGVGTPVYSPVYNPYYPVSYPTYSYPYTYTNYPYTYTSYPSYPYNYSYSSYPYNYGYSNYYGYPTTRVVRVKHRVRHHRYRTYSNVYYQPVYYRY